MAVKKKVSKKTVKKIATAGLTSALSASPKKKLSKKKAAKAVACAPRRRDGHKKVAKKKMVVSSAEIRYSDEKGRLVTPPISAWQAGLLCWPREDYAHARKVPPAPPLLLAPPAIRSCAAGPISKHRAQGAEEPQPDPPAKVFRDRQPRIVPAPP